MNFSRRIFYNDKPLILTDSSHAPKTDDHNRVFEGAKEKNIMDALDFLSTGESVSATVCDPSFADLSELPEKMFRTIVAGGGIVYNEVGDILMIFRRGKWDLPKGKLDEGETIEQCALREVHEETGLKNLRLGKKITDTWHIYPLKNELCIKHSVWFAMDGQLSDVLAPQTEEDILQARWVSTKELAPIAAHAYHAIRDVLLAAGATW
jgi:ADP-ribose pyrophosphatase YjhB (NUDIX family)